MKSEEQEELSPYGHMVESGMGNLYSSLASRLAKHGWFSFWGPVESSTCELCAMFLMNALLSSRERVSIFICSPGGDEDDTRGLLGVMELCKNAGMVIRVYGAGVIASAAFDIFSACSPGYRFAFEATMFMTHSSSGHVEDDDMYKLQKRFDDWTLKHYTNIHASTRRRFLKTGNWWFDPKRAVEYGVADAVIKCGHGLPEGPVFPMRKTAEEQKREAADAVVNGTNDDDEDED